MRKRTAVSSPRLVVRREILRELELRELERVIGGDSAAACTTGLWQTPPKC